MTRPHDAKLMSLCECSEAALAFKLPDDGLFGGSGFHDLVMLTEGFVVAPLAQGVVDVLLACGRSFTDIIIANVEQGAPVYTTVVVLASVDYHARANGRHLVESAVVLVGHLDFDVARTIAKHGCGARRAIADSYEFVVHLPAKG